MMARIEWALKHPGGVTCQAGERRLLHEHRQHEAQLIVVGRALAEARAASLRQHVGPNARVVEPGQRGRDQTALVEVWHHPQRHISSSAWRQLQGPRATD